MKPSFLWLIVPLIGSQSPVFAQESSASHQATDKVCAAEWRSPEISALIKEGEVSCGQDAASGGAGHAEVRALLCELRAEEDDRSYLLQTASPSTTMTLQGPQTAIARLNPEFVARLATAIREARASGLPSAGISSAYRAPAFGVGRFLDRFKSLHAYGLAVDMTGIGEPGSKQAKLWHDIARRHGVFCPYGFDSRTEWNHCQATPTRIVCPDNPLRKTITANGPIELAAMFKVGNAVIDNAPAASCVTVAANRPEDAEAIRPRLAHDAARSASIIEPERRDHGHLHQTRSPSIMEPERLDRRHVHQAHSVGNDPFGRATLSEKERMRFVAADLHLGGRRK